MMRVCKAAVGDRPQVSLAVGGRIIVGHRWPVGVSEGVAGADQGDALLIGLSQPSQGASSMEDSP